MFLFFPFLSAGPEPFKPRLKLRLDRWLERKPVRWRRTGVPELESELGTKRVLERGPRGAPEEPERGPSGLIIRMSCAAQAIEARTGARSEASVESRA